MKMSRIFINLTGTFLLTVMLGCNDLGAQLAKVLPENGGPSIGNGQLSQTGDSKAIDPSGIGGGNSSMTPSMTDHSTEVGGFNDQAIDADYREIMNDGDPDMSMDVNSSDSLYPGFGEDSDMTGLGNFSEGLEDGEFESDTNAQIEMANQPDVSNNVGAIGYMESIAGERSMLEPQKGNSRGDQSFIVNGARGGFEKQMSGRGPQKQMPSGGVGNSVNKRPISNSGIRNLRDRPTKSTGNAPAGNSTNPQKPIMSPNSQNPESRKSTSKGNTSLVEIRMPGNITNPVYDLINAVAVPILLQNDTAMSFSAELLQQRGLTVQGTVYWVVHSQRLGFSRFEIPRMAGRVVGVVAKFTPTSGPFRAFIVAIEPNGQVTYLSSPVDIKWNP